MPGFDLPNDNVQPEEIPVKITAPEYKGKMYDTAYVPQQNIILNMDGIRQTVDWYSQQLNADNQVSFGGPGKANTYAGYTAILGMELRITTPFDPAQEVGDNSMTATGAASVYPCLIPNVGDMFVTDIGDGRMGLFQCTASRRLSIRKDSAHSIDFELLDYADGPVGGPRMADIKAKTIETCYFDRDFATYGQKPIIAKSDYEALRQLRELYGELVYDWVRMFTSHEFKTILVPSQNKPTYDYFLSKAASKFFTGKDHDFMRTNRVLNCTAEPLMASKTIWDALHSRSMDMLPEMAKKVGVVNAVNFTRDPLYDGIRWSGIPYVVYPEAKNDQVDSDYTGMPIGMAGRLIADVDDPTIPSPQGGPYDPITDEADRYFGVPLLYPCMADGYYVLSEAFYERNGQYKSVLEDQTVTYLQRKQLDNNKILALAKSVRGWKRMDRFYQTPVLLVLIFATIRGL